MLCMCQDMNGRGTLEESNPDISSGVSMSLPCQQLWPTPVPSIGSPEKIQAFGSALLGQGDKPHIVKRKISYP